MPTVDDIIAARNAAVNILGQEIQDALAKQNAAANDKAANKFNEPIHKLMIQRIAIFEQAADKVMGSNEITDALNKLRQLTNDMTIVAARMGSVTGFFNNVADILDAGSKVVGVLKGSGA